MNEPVKIPGCAICKKRPGAMLAMLNGKAQYVCFICAEKFLKELLCENDNKDCRKDS